MRARHELRDPAVNHILSGGAPKEFAVNNGVSATWVFRTLCNAGLRKYFLTPDEWQEIRKRRALCSAQSNNNNRQ